MDLSKFGYLLHPTPDDATRWGQRRKVEERWVLPRWREVEGSVDLESGVPLLLARNLLVAVVGRVHGQPLQRLGVLVADDVAPLHALRVELLVAELAHQPRVVPVYLVLDVPAGRLADLLQLVVGPAAGCAGTQRLLRPQLKGSMSNLSLICRPNEQTLEGSFSSVSRPNFATKYSLESS